MDINTTVSEVVDWGVRKTLLDIFQHNGGHLLGYNDWDETIYPALIAVAEHGARCALENAQSDALDNA